MKIDRNNYEVWMIDYFDGKLNAAEKAELMAFIEENPDIKAEFKQFDEDVVFEPEEIKFSDKKALKKVPLKATESINEENYETYFISYYENDLDQDQQKEVLGFVALNPELKNEFEFHGRLSAKADLNLVYIEKSSLKRNPVLPVYWTVASAAAVIVLLFGLFQLLKTESSESEQNNMRQLIVSAIEPATINMHLGSTSTAQILIPSLKVIDHAQVADQNVREEQLAFHSIKSLNTNNSISDQNYPIVISIPQTEVYDPNLLIADANPTGRKSAVGRIIQNLATRLTGNTQSQDNEEENNDEPRFVKALGKSISVFNSLTGSDTELVKTYNKKGKLSGYSVEGESITFHREIIKPESNE